MKKDKKEKKESFLVQLLKKKKSHKIAKPKTTSQIMRMFFSGFNEANSIIQIDDSHFSVCFEYQDISFSKVLTKNKNSDHHFEYRSIKYKCSKSHGKLTTVVLNTKSGVE